MMKYRVVIWGLGARLGLTQELVRPDVSEIVGYVDACTVARVAGAEVYPLDRLVDTEFDFCLATMAGIAGARAEYLALGLPAEKLFFVLGDSEADCPAIDNWHRRYYLQSRELQKYKYAALNAPYEYGASGYPELAPTDELFRRLRAGASLARFGDGEFEMMRMRERSYFQRPDAELSRRLREVIGLKRANLTLAIADNFGSLTKYTPEAAQGIREYLWQEASTREEIRALLSGDIAYYDAYVTRCYMIYRDKNYAERIFAEWQSVWQGRDVIIIEGWTSRMGRGSDLLGGARTVRRILCPERNAFDRYAEILACVREKVTRDRLVLISLGPTATVLAADLAADGYQAIDIGQLDNEYDWYRMGASHRVAIPGKTTAEVVAGRAPRTVDDAGYEREIIATPTVF